MKTFFILAALAGLGFAGFKVIRSGSPRGTLTRAIELPGVAISRLDVSGGDPVSIMWLVGAVVVVLLILYVIMSR